MASLNVQQVSDALTAVSSLVPQIQVAMTAYNLLKRIWLVQNPGKTEEDFYGYLDTWSKTNISETATVLIADGFVETPPGSGNWKKPDPMVGGTFKA